jgi:dihydrofolate reductase
MRIMTYGGAVSLDGFLAATDGALDWLHFSDDVQKVMAEYFKDVDTILMGRKTYEVSIAHQNKPRKKTEGQSDPKDAKPAIRTCVFSRTLKTIDDPDVELVTRDAAEFVRDLKAQPGGAVCLMGGGVLATSMFAAGLVDRVGLNIHPILLGSGVPAFRDPGMRVPLKLTGSRTLDGGCILANFEVLNANVS